MNISPRFTPHNIIPGLRRIRLVLEYDGTPYHGWQSQKSPAVPTVESIIHQSFKKLTNTHPEDLVAAGRTDKGVHARAMTCHLDTFHSILPEKLKTGLNRHLPESIAVLEAEETDQNFHARFLCTKRAYHYCILNRYSRSPLYAKRAAIVRPKLDLNAMQEAAKFLAGTHDFSAFRSSECQAKSPTTTLNMLEVTSDERGFISFHLEGTVFLHNMVRILTGTLVDVGLGRLTPTDVANILEQKDRTNAGKTMPACGLYFQKAFYYSV